MNDQPIEITDSPPFVKRDSEYSSPLLFLVDILFLDYEEGVVQGITRWYKVGGPTFYGVFQLLKILKIMV